MNLEANSSEPARRSKRILWSGIAGSFALLSCAIGVEAGYPWVLKVPAQWLALAALPALIALVKVGLVDEFNFAGVGFKKEIKDLGFFPRSSEWSPERATVAKAFDALRSQDRGVEIRAAAEVSGWSASQEREQSYQQTNSLELVHIYRPSRVRHRAYDISVYLMRHILEKITIIRLRALLKSTMPNSSSAQTGVTVSS